MGVPIFYKDTKMVKIVSKILFQFPIFFLDDEDSPLLRPAIDHYEEEDG